jgi:NADH dehydrogenase
MCIRSLNSVRLINQHIAYQFAKNKMFPHQPEHLTFVVAGAGLTGSEFVGELLDRIPGLCQQFDIAPEKVKVYLIDAAPTALPPGFPAVLVECALEHFRKQGAIVRLSAPVERIKQDGVELVGGEEIKASTVIWAGGIRGNRLLQEAGFPVQRGQALVADNMLIQGYNHIFAIGDSALQLKEDGSGKPYPSNAQTAIQQGNVCADNVLAALRGLALRRCRPHIRGTLVSLGSGKAVGVVGTRFVKGRLAMLMKELVSLKYLLQIGGLRLLLHRAARSATQKSAHPK